MWNVFVVNWPMVRSLERGTLRIGLVVPLPFMAFLWLTQIGVIRSHIYIHWDDPPPSKWKGENELLLGCPWYLVNGL